MGLQVPETVSENRPQCMPPTLFKIKKSAANQASGCALRQGAAALCLAMAAMNTHPAAADSQPSAVLQPIGQQIELPKRLREASGVAAADRHSIFTHNDEAAIIYEISLRDGEILREVPIGNPPVAGDFEAISVVGPSFSLLTSNGAILKGKLSAGKASDVNLDDTGLGGTCETEGFAPQGRGRKFLIACKNSGKRLVIYSWKEGSKASKVIDRKLAGLAPNPKQFQASDIFYDGRTDSILVLDSAGGAILEISMKGERLGYWVLGGEHPQAEGMTVLKDGRIVVVDEGGARKGDRRALLTVFPPRR